MAFNAQKTSTFLSLMLELFLIDCSTPTGDNTAAKSYSRFEELLLKHSVSRPPKSILVFEREDIDPIIEYVTERYFRNFPVFCHIFGTVSRCFITQKLPNDIEVPKMCLPLAEGNMMSTESMVETQ
jgi:hypothetical protein